MEELLSADTCKGETCWVKRKRTAALWATCQPVRRTSIQHDRTGLETGNRHKDPLKNWVTHWKTVIRWRIHSTVEGASLPLVAHCNLTESWENFTFLGFSKMFTSLSSEGHGMNKLAGFTSPSPLSHKVMGAGSRLLYKRGRFDKTQWDFLNVADHYLQLYNQVQPTLHFLLRTFFFEFVVLGHQHNTWSLVSVESSESAVCQQ